MQVEEIADKYRQELRQQISEIQHPIRLVGFLASDNPPSKTYAQYTRKACEDVGIEFEIREIANEDLISQVERANQEDSVHAIMIYYPIFGDQRDESLRDHIKPEKDIEGLSSFWIGKLYQNERILQENPRHKAILPCTSLAIEKVIEESPYFEKQDPLPLKDRTAVIFNRSDVVGRPLAAMLANDGATVYSFDIDGVQTFHNGQILNEDISRAQALASADIIVTGVPSKSFDKVSAAEIKDKALCINFSTVQNFQSDIESKALRFYRKVGPLTVTMCMRNAFRLYTQFGR